MTEPSASWDEPPRNDDRAAVQRRIAEALLSLADPTAVGGQLLPPPAYIRRHLVEHAAAGEVLDERILSPGFLPYVDATRLHRVLGRPTMDLDPATGAQVAAWRSTTARWQWDLPAANAAALGFSAAARGSGADQSFPPRGSAWRTKWAHWPTAGEVIVNTEAYLYAVATAQVAGRQIAVTGGSDGVRLTDLLTGEPIGQPLDHDGVPVWAVATATVRGRPVAVAGGPSGRLRAWDLATAQPFQTPLTDGYGGVHALATVPAPHGPILVIVGHTGVRVIDLLTGTLLRPAPREYAGPVSAVTTAVLAGRPVAVTGGSDGALRVWDLLTGEPARSPLSKRAGTVLSLATADVDGRTLIVSTADDETVSLWRLEESGKPQRGEMLTYDRAVSAAATTVDGRPVVLVCRSDGSVQMWDLLSRQPSGEPIPGHRTSLTSIATTRIAQRPVAITASDDGTARLWDLQAPEWRRGSTEHTSVSHAVDTAYLGGHQVVFTGSEDARIRIWDLLTGAAAGITPAGKEPVRAMAAGNLAGRTLVAFADGGLVRVWDASESSYAEPTFVSQWPVEVPTLRLALTEVDGTALIVAGGLDGRLQAWEVGSGELRWSPRFVHTGAVLALGVTKLRGRTVVFTAGDAGPHGSVGCWNLTTGRPIRRPLLPEGNRPRALACTTVRGRPVVVVGHADGSFQVCEPLSRREARVVTTAHQGEVLAVGIGILGGRSTAVTAGTDETVRAWDLSTLREVAEPLTTLGPIEDLAVLTRDLGTSLSLVLAGSGVAKARLAAPQPQATLVLSRLSATSLHYGDP